jgi:heme/copper-type cytochrome/quinol oxidase subunit 2
MNKLVILSIIMFSVGIGLFIFTFLHQSPQKESNEAITKTIPNASAEQAIERFNVEANGSRFFVNNIENGDIKVKTGDIVDITFRSTQGYHDFVIDEFEVKTQKMNPGGTARLGFTASKKGTFSYYCSVGDERKNGMQGRFIVE